MLAGAKRSSKPCGQAEVLSTGRYFHGPVAVRRPGSSGRVEKRGAESHGEPPRSGRRDRWDVVSRLGGGGRGAPGALLPVVDAVAVTLQLDDFGVVEEGSRRTPAATLSPGPTSARSALSDCLSGPTGRRPRWAQ